MLDQQPPSHEAVSTHTTPSHNSKTTILEGNTVSQKQEEQQPKHPLNHNTPDHTNNSSKMVAGIFSPHNKTTASGTPPESPLQNKNHPLMMMPKQQEQQKGVRRSTPESPNYGMSNTTNSGSPLRPPISDRMQPATAQAPVVGRHHKKSNSLVGFDPLLDSAISSSATTATTPITPSATTPNHGKVAVLGPAAMAHLTMPPPPLVTVSPGNNINTNPAGQAEAELHKELQKLTHEVVATASPALTKSKVVSKPKFGRAASLTAHKFTLTPPFRSNDKTGTKTKLPWQRHRRSQSLQTPDEIMGAVAAAATTTTAQQSLQHRAGSFETDTSNDNLLFVPPLSVTDKTKNPSSNKRASTGSSTMIPASPMMQDLYEVVKAQEEDQHATLTLPSLARPAPTSFLTGKEIVRSSEQDPSPFQMELVGLEDILVAARLVQFVEHYRKEDMNLDLSMSFVGLSRSSMQSFVMNDDSLHNNTNLPANLTETHRPVVESLLEAADDVTVLEFYATENAESADTRREAVLLERQMQIVVVFRGTTQEQAAKSPFFKKNHSSKHNNALEALDTDASHAECKVYASIKQAYMELETRVFAGLDKYMDENPFCDVVFAGQSTGGAMATLAAYRYATNRPMVRVSCQTFGSPKVGDRVFRQQANSLPNLKVMRIENANDPKCLAPDAVHGSHVGHSIVLSKTHDGSGLVATAFKFDDDHDARKQRSSKPNILAAAFKKERDITSYVSTLEQMNQAKPRHWPTDFKGEDGTGVRGKDNEQRQVV